MRKQRVISAIVLIALAAAATALGSYVLGALILVFICMGIYEIYKAFENNLSLQNIAIIIGNYVFYCLIR